MRSRGEIRAKQRVCLGFIAGRSFVRLAANFFAAYRPAGTREALPGTMRGTCFPRFDRKSTACRGLPKKILALVLPTHALEKLYGS
jgi:hypothetical protein